MFTGIVEGQGTIIRQSAQTFWIRHDFDPSSIALGDSISHSGVCLTVTAMDGQTFSVDVGHETLARTSLGELRVGAKVNLERSCTLQSRLGGHLVQGHVDAVGEVRSIVPKEGAHDWTFSAPPEVLALAIPRGSIAIDGISLTVTGRDRESFSVMIIPHTAKVTTLGAAKVGSKVNLEVDMIARYVAGLLEAYQPEQRSGITADFLEKHGY